ncbi:hypothetical protein U9M48_019715 [Paspalum notatum var. saurae]|uniref:Uncharacterized protein n=1 Tax=Paspalum notatum var. saurae TaxID=547442 RepID=A0AAQ3WRT9_PASNO
MTPCIPSSTGGDPAADGGDPVNPVVSRRSRGERRLPRARDQLRPRSADPVWVRSPVAPPQSSDEQRLWQPLHGQPSSNLLSILRTRVGEERGVRRQIPSTCYDE